MNTLNQILIEMSYDKENKNYQSEHRSICCYGLREAETTNKFKPYELYFFMSTLIN